MRSNERPYGLPRSLLSPRQREEAWRGTYHALQTIALLQASWVCGVGSATLVPPLDPDAPSVLHLPEGHTLLRLPGVRVPTPDLCTYGARDPHPAPVASFRVNLAGRSFSCNQPPIPRQWRDLSGRPQAGTLSHFPEFRRALADGSSAATREAPLPLHLHGVVGDGGALVPAARGDHRFRGYIRTRGMAYATIQSPQWRLRRIEC